MDKPDKTIEQKAADVILETPVTIAAGGKIYRVAPPTTATLIMLSATISKLPRIEYDSNRPIEEMLAAAKDLSAIGEIIAVLILGAKKAEESIFTETISRRKILWGATTLCKKTKTASTRKEMLAKELLETMSPRELHNAVAQILMTLQIGDFFGLTTFLTGINLLHRTKVVTEAIQSGL